MFRTVPLSIIRSFSLYTLQWYMSYRFYYKNLSWSTVTWTPKCQSTFKCSIRSTVSQWAQKGNNFPFEHSTVYSTTTSLWNHKYGHFNLFTSNKEIISQNIRTIDKVRCPKLTLPWTRSLGIINFHYGGSFLNYIGKQNVSWKKKIRWKQKVFSFFCLTLSFYQITY